MSFPKLERAKTGRSTCRGCGEGIAADEMRVGIEAFVAGRVADTWQHPRCALNACFLEVAPAKRGKCKATDEPFAKGDARLALCSKDHKTFYGVKGMGDALRPILDAVDDFAVSNITGLADLDDENRAAVLAALGVDDDANAGAKKRARRSRGGSTKMRKTREPTMSCCATWLSPRTDPCFPPFWPWPTKP